MAELIGNTIGNYRIESLLGTGGMGQVYLGVHLHLNRPAAVKVMHAHLAGEESFKRRFRQEARSVAALSHPHIVQTWDFGTQDGNFYLVMELLTDGSLRSLVGSDEANQPGWAIHVGLDLVRQAAEGLAYAHSRGMVHRDIKPDNLLLQRRPDDFGDDAAHDLSVKITDFGLARMTEEESATGPSLVMGTPAFMSPELCQGLPLDGRSDIYSLGVVLYQIVTGRLPFETRSAAEAIYKHVYASPPRPSEYWPEIPLALEEIVMRCLAKQPDERFASSAELARALRAVGEELAPLAPSPGRQANETSSYRTPSPVPAVRPLPTPRSAAVAQVVISAGSGSARQVVGLGVDGLVVGSLPDNDIVLGDAGVFGRHLRIDWDGEQASVTDLGSSSGTTLGGDPLTPHQSQSWDAGDELRIGSQTLRLMLPSVVAVDAAEQTIATPVPLPSDNLTGEHAGAATMSVGRRAPGLTSNPSRLRRLPILAAAAVIAILLSVGGLQALSSGERGGDRDATASSIDTDDPVPSATTEAAVAAEPTETLAATGTAAASATSTPEPTSTARGTATPKRTPSPQSTNTSEPPATQPPLPPAPTNTLVPSTATPTAPVATATPTPTIATPSPEATATAEPTAPQEPEPTAPVEPTEEPDAAPTAPVEPTQEPVDTPDPEPTPDA